jgi:adenylylsulfate kinase
MKENIIRQNYEVSQLERNQANKHRSFLVWFTGLSGSGKSTIANALEHKLHQEGIKTYVLDGDNIRLGINKDLSFSAEDRSENMRRIAEIAKLFIDAGVVVMGAFVSPYKKDRKSIEYVVGNNNFVEVFVNTSLEACELRDVKGLYAKARKGEIKDFTGINAPYEAPENPDIEVVTDNMTVREAVDIIYPVIIKKLKIE